MPSPDGGYETHAFDTFTAIALTAIHEFPSRAMQSRCIVLVMKRATQGRGRAAGRVRRGARGRAHRVRPKARALGGRPRGVAPVNKKDTGLINRIWLNWRPLLQIAELAGGTWPARALAAAKADMARVTGEKDDSAEYALLAAIWRVLAADKSNPRRMLTRDLDPQASRRGRGALAHGGQGGRRSTSTTYANKLKKLLPPKVSTQRANRAAGARIGTPRRLPLYGYHELHFADAFERYLGKGLPSGQAGHLISRPTIRIRDASRQRFCPRKGGLDRFIRPSDLTAENDR